MSAYEASLNGMVETAFKIRDRTLKTEVIQELQECKEKAAAIMAVLRNSQGRIDNQQIAQLNDMAYRGL